MSKTKLQIGDPAPDFELTGDDGSRVRLSAFRGRRVVVYFYPEDDTPGCTTQACGFRDRYPQIEERQAVVLGISPDDLASHKKFKTKYNLPFLLLVDEGHRTAEAYGVWENGGNLRSHFVVDEGGRLADIRIRVKPEESVHQALDVLGIGSSGKQPDRKREETMANESGPSVSPAARFVTDKRWAWFWLIVRLYVGWQWVMAGWGKVTDPKWVGSEAGTSLTGFLQRAVGLASGEHPSVQSWYASFIQNAVLPQAGVWSYVVAFGELLVGVGLILGILTGLAAFFGGFMNFNYLLAGTVSTNAILLVMEIGLALAWRIAGWWGGDRWVLPLIERIRIRR